MVSVLSGSEAASRIGGKQLKQSMEEIWSDSMGSSYIDEALLEGGIGGSNSVVLLVAIDGDNVAGFAGGRTMTFNELDRRVRSADVGKIVPSINVSDPIALAEIVCVSPNYRGQGIATRVGRQLVQNLSSLSNLVFAEAWIREGKADGSDVLDSLGFTLLYKSDRYWMKSTSGQCNECHNNPCTCPGELYVYSR